MNNNRGREGDLKERGLVNFFPLKGGEGDLLEMGGLFERGASNRGFTV